VRARRVPQAECHSVVRQLIFDPMQESAIAPVRVGFEPDVQPARWIGKLCQLRRGAYGYFADVVTRRSHSPDRIVVRSLTAHARSDVKGIVRERLCLLVRRSPACA
jgi:hypothetical protein